MCFEENCLPLCARWNHLNDTYCKEKGLGLYASSAGRGPRGERLEKPCSADDRFIADSGANLWCWFTGLFGVGCKIGIQRARECRDYRTATTGQDHYITMEAVNGGGDVTFFFKVLEGKR